MNIKAYMESVGLTSGQIDMVTKIADQSNAVSLVESFDDPFAAAFGDDDEDETVEIDDCKINGDVNAHKFLGELNSMTGVSMPVLSKDEPACKTYAQFIADCLRAGVTKVNTMKKLGKLTDVVNDLIKIEPRLVNPDIVANLSTQIESLLNSILAKYDKLVAKSEAKNKKSGGAEPGEPADVTSVMGRAQGFDIIAPNADETFMNDESDTEYLADSFTGGTEETNEPEVNEDADYEDTDMTTRDMYSIDMVKKLYDIVKLFAGAYVAQTNPDAEGSELETKCNNELSSIFGNAANVNAKTKTIDSFKDDTTFSYDDRKNTTDKINAALRKYISMYKGSLDSLLNTLTPEQQDVLHNADIPADIQDAIGLNQSSANVNADSIDSSEKSDAYLSNLDANRFIERTKAEKKDEPEKTESDVWKQLGAEGTPMSSNDYRKKLVKDSIHRVANRNKVLAESQLLSDDDSDESVFDVFDDDCEAVDEYLFNRKHERQYNDDVESPNVPDESSLAEPDIDPTSDAAKDVVNDYATQHAKSLDREDVNNCDAFAANCGDPTTKSQPWSNRAKDIAKRSLAKLMAKKQEKTLAEADEGDELDAITSTGSSKDYLANLVKNAVKKAQVQKIERKHNDDLATVLGERSEGGYMNYRDRLKQKALGK